MSRAAMMQALDALAPFRGDGLIIVNQAIATLQAALAQPEPEPVKPLTEDAVLKAIQSCGMGLKGRIALTCESGPYDMALRNNVCNS